tara:strand:- start:1953 stop:2204 length:252 start_codon:yes stop_codon:yes gene_type:complete
MGVETVAYSGVTPDPRFLVVENGLEMLRQNHCDAVLAVGGGSSIDAAKVIALAAMKEAHGTYAVPIYLNKAEIIQVLRALSAS